MGPDIWAARGYRHDGRACLVVVIGTLLEGALHNAAWLRDDPFAVWFGIFAAFVAFMLGALGVAPWLIVQALGESCVRRSASAEHAHT